ncbi:MAG: rod shape-determining protein MreD [Actinobacteria bacterium]|nr:rod shape-determining protein MreD [Actinomycetota bacterium]
MLRKELRWVGKAALLFVIAVILQSLILSRVSILGVTADLFLILTVVVGLGRGSLEGAVFGFLAGLVHDTIYFQILGVHSLIFVLVGYFVGMFVTRFGTVNLWAIFVLAGVSSFAAQLVFGVVQFAMGPRAAFFAMVGTQMIPEAVFDALIAIPIYALLVRVRILTAPGPEKVQAGAGAE